MIGIFKKKEKITYELYCQNPQCNQVIQTGSIANLDEALVHKDIKCIQDYMCHQLAKSGESIKIYPKINYISYQKAQELARKGKIKFNKLEGGLEE